jgi:hypothetical protein
MLRVGARMRHIDREAIARDAVARLYFLEEFVGFTRDDWLALGDSAAVLNPRLPAILDDFYDHLLAFDDTRRIFEGSDGAVDPHYITVRKEHLTEWLLTLVSGLDRKQLVAYWTKVARHHGPDGSPERRVPPRYLVGLTSYIQTRMWRELFDALGDRPAEVRRLGLAWNKLLIIQLELFLKLLAPEWPRWDEH